MGISYIPYFVGVCKILWCYMISTWCHKTKAFFNLVGSCSCSSFHQAIDTRDALAKSIYASLFDWIVDQINISLGAGKRRTGRSISILDIYGFESFTKNSFEQFCINYANERLQQHFNRHLFKLEQEEYIEDGIDWKKVDFEDNQDCLNLFEKKPLGLLSLLDEESTFPNATDLTFATKLKQHLDSNPCFIFEYDQLIKNLVFFSRNDCLDIGRASCRERVLAIV